MALTGVAANLLPVTAAPILGPHRGAGRYANTPPMFPADFGNRMALDSTHFGVQIEAYNIRGN